MTRLLKIMLVKLIFLYSLCIGNSLMDPYSDVVEQRLRMVIEIITHNWKNNGWTNLLAVGNFSDSFFSEIHLETYHTFSVTDFTKKHRKIKRTVPYHSNTIVINCSDFKQFELAMTSAVTSPYWHSLSNVILYYHSIEKKEVLAKMFFIFWYYRAVNVIIVQYDDYKELLLISQFNPFTCDKLKTQSRFACWTYRKINFPLDTFENSFVCEEGCDSVPLESKRRFNNLGTCLGIDTYPIPFSNKLLIHGLNLFYDKGKNLQGCALRAFAVQVLPFLGIRELADGSFTLYARDGILWNTVSERMNFTIDLSHSRDIIKQPFNFEANIQQVFAFIQRKVDLLLYPIYQFDVVIAEIDNTIAFKESGVCFVSQRAGFETTIFDFKFFQKNINNMIEFTICFFCCWFTFFIFNVEQFGRFSFDQMGKDLLNTYKITLSISLSEFPKRGSFRIFLTITIWGFFVINFSTQAAIISVFSAHKRGKDVDTMEDIIEKGYPIEGVASPDMVLPEGEERFQIINARRVPIQDLFGCVDAISNDSHRFCLIDCAVGRYLERNRLNTKGQQYLHIATRDRLHSHYLNMILHKHSTLTATYNKIILALVEAGIIKKWEKYRFNDIKEEAPIKALQFGEIIGIFEFYAMLIVTDVIIFLIELGIGLYFWIKSHGIGKLQEWLRSFCKKLKKRDNTNRPANLRNVYTQTNTI